MVVTEASLASLARDPQTLDAGRKVFAVNCVGCHLESGGGQTGPNLTDEHQIHGVDRLHIYKTIREGVPDKGMLAWGTILQPRDVAAVAAYLTRCRAPTSRRQGRRGRQGRAAALMPVARTQSACGRPSPRRQPAPLHPAVAGSVLVLRALFCYVLIALFVARCLVQIAPAGAVIDLANAELRWSRDLPALDARSWCSGWWSCSRVPVTACGAGPGSAGLPQTVYMGGVPADRRFSRDRPARSPADARRACRGAGRQESLVFARCRSRRQRVPRLFVGSTSSRCGARSPATHPLVRGDSGVARDVLDFAWFPSRPASWVPVRRRDVLLDRGRVRRLDAAPASRAARPGSRAATGRCNAFVATSRRHRHPQRLQMECIGCPSASTPRSDHGRLQRPRPGLIRTRPQDESPRRAARPALTSGDFRAVRSPAAC